jgi:signal transduction histidine kinase
MRISATTSTVLAAVLATAVILTVVFSADLRFGYEAPALRVALETAATLIAVLAASIVLGRFLRTRRLDMLVLVGALLLLGLSNLLLMLVIAVGGGSGIGRLVAASGTLLGAIALAVAAFVPRRRLDRVAGPVLVFAGAVAVGLLVAMTVLAMLYAGYRDEVLAVADADARSPHARLVPALVLTHVLAMAPFAAAAVGFTRRAASSGDDLFRWLAVAATISAFARVNYFLYPRVDADWVYTGDVFRFVAYFLLLVGAGREMASYWRGLADTAVLEERRRLARDLHDGVAQELAFIDRRARRLLTRPDTAIAEQIAAAAERGLADSRRAIAALTRPLNEPLDLVLTQAAEEVAARSGVPLALDLDLGVEVSPDAREALVRIACEAIGNATRHSQASVVRVELRRGERVRLRVLDDGVGFDPTGVGQTATGGFGLVSMRERAQALGGALTVRSAPGAGTRVEVEL